MNDDPFCPDCGVVLDLHHDPEADDPSERGCDIANRKADLLSMWGRPITGPTYTSPGTQ